MKILLVHNRYQIPGGEDRVFTMERELLQQNGHQVILYERTNDEIREIPWTGRLKLALSTVNSREAYIEIKEIIARAKPDIAHFHNTFPLISPLAYYAAKEAGIPVIQTLHNFRFFCANGLYLRNGYICEDCMDKVIPWPAVMHRCYRDSRFASMTVACMQAFHRAKHTWQEKVDRYITFTEFGKQKFIQGGLPAEKIVIKPNFIYPAPNNENGINENGIKRKDKEFGLYIGRLSHEKGIKFLLDAWKKLPDIPLKVIGDGPIYRDIQNELNLRSSHAIELVGWLNRDQIFQLLQKASFLVFPSICYENFPTVILEAFANGVAAIVSDIGAAKEIVEDQKTGLLYKSGEIGDFVSKITWAWKNPEKMYQFGMNAREVFEQKYSAEQNYKQLMSIYQAVLR